MSEKYVEKSFLYLLALSLLLHAGGFVMLARLPTGTPVPKEPVFVDLQGIPETTIHETKRQEARQYSDRQVRTDREIAPRGYSDRDSGMRSRARSLPAPTQSGGRAGSPGSSARGEARVPEGSSVSGLLKSRSQATYPSGQSSDHTARFFPGAAGMAAIEDGYRRKFGKDVTEGNTRFLNTDDIKFASFLRRFETSVYGVWRYPEEAARNGIRGITPVKITFNRSGEILNVQLLESSGAKILDEEVLNTLKKIGPVGNLPKGYDKDEFHLIAFFHYGLTRKLY